MKDNNTTTTTSVPSCAGAVPGTVSLPSPQELTYRYHDALDGLHKGYTFGKCLLEIQDYLNTFTGSDTRVIAREGANGGTLLAGGWNAGSGLKGWLEANCPEIAYHTARRFLKLAENVHIALDKMGLKPTETNVRNFLEGKTQRQLLKPAEEEKEQEKSLAITTEARAQKLADTMSDYTRSLEGMLRTGETLILTPDHRRDLITRLKAIARKLEEEM